MDYSKWNDMVNGNELMKDVKEIEKNNGKGGDFPEIPDDKYEVKIEKIDLKATKKEGLPLVSVQFKIIKGKFKNMNIWANWSVSNPYGMHFCDEFLRSLEVDTPIGFDGNWEHYANMLADILEEVGGKVGFVLDYGTNDKGFHTYKIEDSWEF